MSKTRDTGYLANVIQVHDTGVRIMSGSTMLMAVSSSGAVTITGELSGSDAANSLLLNGTGSVGFTTTGSFLAVSSSQQQVSASYIALSGSYNTFSGSASTRITVDSASLLQVSSSQQQISASLLQVSASYTALSGSYNTYSSSVSTRTTQIEQVYATTGSNSFRATQSITGSLTVTGQIIAQTINIQQVTSSIIYSSGSNVFGCDINSRQTFTGSFYQTGSVASFSNCVIIGGALSGSSATLSTNISSAALTLDVSNSGTYGIIGIRRGTQCNSSAGINYYTTTSQKWFTGIYENTDNFGFYNAATVTFPMVITTCNNVGIGAAMAPTKLYVADSNTANCGCTIARFDNSVCNLRVSIVDESTTGGCAGGIFSNTGYGLGLYSCTPSDGGGVKFYTANALTFHISGCGRAAIGGFACGNSYKLQLYGSSAVDGVGLFICDTNSNRAYTIRNEGPFIIRDASAGVDRINLTTGGNLGIGTPVPGRKLDVCGVVRANAYDVYYNCATSGYLLTETQWTGVAGANNIALVAEGGISCGGNLTFFTNGSATERMRLTTGGRLGIADSNPNMLVSLGTSVGRKLHMYNDGGASDIGGGLGVDLGGFSAETSIFYGCYGGAGRFSIGSWSSANCYSTKVTVNANGEFLVGTTVGTSTDPVHRIGTNGGTTYARLMIQERTGVWLSLNTGGANIGTVYQNGSVVVYGGTSDYRLKDNIKPMSCGIERVMKLKPVEYTWKRDCSYGEGFIAHELQEVVPIAVTGTKDGINEVGDPDWQNVDKSHIVPVLVKAIQEQQCTINLLKTCIGIS